MSRRTWVTVALVLGRGRAVRAAAAAGRPQRLRRDRQPGHRGRSRRATRATCPWFDSRVLPGVRRGRVGAVRAAGRAGRRGAGVRAGPVARPARPAVRRSPRPAGRSTAPRDRSGRRRRGLGQRLAAAGGRGQAAAVGRARGVRPGAAGLAGFAAGRADRGRRWRWVRPGCPPGCSGEPCALPLAFVVVGAVTAVVQVVRRRASAGRRTPPRPGGALVGHALAGGAVGPAAGHHHPDVGPAAGAAPGPGARPRSWRSRR